MIAKDKISENENNINMIEYLASFWNSDAVKRIKEQRNNNMQHNFLGDEEFEDKLISGEYKENPLLDAIVNMRKQESERKEAALYKSTQNNRHPRAKVPTDLSNIKTLLNKFNTK